MGYVILTLILCMNAIWGYTRVQKNVAPELIQSVLFMAASRSFN